MRYDDYISTVEEWNGEAKQGFADILRADYDKWRYGQAAMESELEMARDHIERLKDFRSEHGFGFAERLDMSQTSDAAFMPSVTDEQERLRKMAEYAASGDNYRELAGILRDALYVQRQEQVGLKGVYQDVFGTDVTKLLKETNEAAQSATQKALDEELARRDSMGVRDYAVESLNTYGIMPSTQTEVVKDGLRIQQDQADFAYASKMRRRDELARDAQRQVRLNDEMGYDLDEERPFAEYERYNAETNFTKELDDFHGSCRDMYAALDADESRKQLEDIFKEIMSEAEWEKLKATLPGSSSPGSTGHGGIDAELAAAFDKPYDAWEAEHQDQLE